MGGFHEERAALDAGMEARWAGMQEIQAGFRQAVLDRYAAEHPGRKRIWEKAVAKPWYGEMRKDWQARYNAAHDAREAFRKETEARLFELAQAAEIERSDEWLEIGRSSASTYHTQGFGATRYARNAAEAIADKARLHGVEAEVRETRRSDLGAVSMADFSVVAKVTQRGADVLEYRPEPELRDIVRLCWKRGTNPRVYYPFLPQGYEEKAGLDFFGNDLRKSEADAEQTAVPAM